MILTKLKIPFVSVIVPVYNDEMRITTCLNALINQSYPSSCYEIIIVDNGSNDLTVKKIEEFSVKIVHENKIQSSYAARNKGLKFAKGEILAFTDSDCTPSRDWIREGVNALFKNNADLASGNVLFIFSPQRTGAEIYDSIINMQIKDNIENRNVSKTANLFVRKEVFNTIGCFPTVKSGGDVLWTKAATEKGFSLVYHAPAEIAHPARKMRALMKKQYRVGKGQAAILAKSGNSQLRNTLLILSQLLPVQILRILKTAKSKNKFFKMNELIRMSAAGYICDLSNFIGKMQHSSQIIKQRHFWKHTSAFSKSNLSPSFSVLTKCSLYDVLSNSADYALSIQNDNGSFPAGHNGPYYDPETPVRNTAHWLFLLASMYQRTGEKRWYDAGTKAIEYLMSSEARPYGKAFHCRNKKGRDKCNGLIGQAWGIEALIKASEAFGRQDCYELAEEIFRLHPWCEDIGIWQRIEIDGTILSFDRTFNHQLWFAAACSMLKKTPDAQSRTKDFLERIADKVQLYENGIIFHLSTMGSFYLYLKKDIKTAFDQVKLRLKKRIMKKQYFPKSAGYHGFNVYAFAMFKKAFPDASIWNNRKFKMLINSHRNERFDQYLQKSEFSYRYNLTGIEIAYAVEMFFQDKPEAAFWIKRQLEESYLDPTHPVLRNVIDVHTADARIYEAARLINNYEIFHD
jgi:glycosyltransferase involved in cell wall biosynthesis